MAPWDKSPAQHISKTLDRSYRNDGWGRITDKALQIAPSDVESQARRVAEWAHDQLQQRDKLIANLLCYESCEGWSIETYEMIANVEGDYST